MIWIPWGRFSSILNWEKFSVPIPSSPSTAHHAEMLSELHKLFIQLKAHSHGREKCLFCHLDCCTLWHTTPEDVVSFRDEWRQNPTTVGLGCLQIVVWPRHYSGDLKVYSVYECDYFKSEVHCCFHVMHVFPSVCLFVCLVVIDTTLNPAPHWGCHFSSYCVSMIQSTILMIDRILRTKALKIQIFSYILPKAPAHGFNCTQRSLCNSDHVRSTSALFVAWKTMNSPTPGIHNFCFWCCGIKKALASLRFLTESCHCSKLWYHGSLLWLCWYILYRL